MLLLFLFTGSLLSIRFRFVQFRGLYHGLRSILPHRCNGDKSTYSSLCTALAATIGTGNIVGVATAISVGGPGSLFWMLFAGLLGMSTQFAEGFLAVRYGSVKDQSGGPFRYMERGLGRKITGKFYALLVTIAGLLGIGTVVQINSIAHCVDSLFPRENMTMAFSPPVLGICVLVCILSALVLLGGAKRISKICGYFVPFMTAIFMFCSLLLLICRIEEIPRAFALIWEGAFRPKAAMGAGVGISLQQVLRMGVSRGVFTNEAGMGTAAIAASSSGVRDPYEQGLTSMSATFIDTLIICTVSGLCLLVSDAWTMPLEGSALMSYAWVQCLPWKGMISEVLLNLCLIFFAFATILGWGFYAESCLLYLTGGKGLKLYRLAYITTLLIGPFMTVTAAFSLADILNGLMAVPNLLTILFLQEEVVKEVRKKD